MKEQIGDRTIYVIDGSDVTKPHSEKLEGDLQALDRGYDDHEESIIRATKSRSPRYKDKTVNILAVANRFKGKYRIDFKDQKGKIISCKTSVIPVSLSKYIPPTMSLVMPSSRSSAVPPPALLTSSLHLNLPHSSLSSDFGETQKCCKRDTLLRKRDFVCIIFTYLMWR